MKKYLINLIVLFLLGGTCSVAQLKKGNLLVGADISNVNLSLDKGGNFSFILNPKFGVFLKDNVAVGTFILFGLNTAKDEGTSIDYGIGGFGRYYLIKTKVDTVGLRNNKSSFFFEGNAGIEGNNPATGNNTNGLGLGVGPGWTYFVTPNIGVEALLKYNIIIGFGPAVTSNNLNLSLGFQIYLPFINSRE